MKDKTSKKNYLELEQSPKRGVSVVAKKSVCGCVCVCMYTYANTIALIRLAVLFRCLGND